jgi:hypothetical protein
VIAFGLLRIRLGERSTKQISSDSSSLNIILSCSFDGFLKLDNFYGFLTTRKPFIKGWTSH